MGRQASAEPGTPGGESAAFRPFWDTYHTIRDRYAGGDVSRDAVVQGAIRGMIDSLDDPYSQYLTSDEYRSNLQGISGEFEGIGAEIATQASDGTASCATLGPTCRLVIIAPLGGSPAEKAGLRAGDLVLATDGVPLDGLSVDAARAKIRGPKGSVLELSVVRGSAAPFALRITRDVILEQEVESKALADGTVGYVRLEGFSDRSAADLTDALRTHVQAGRKQLILDLRGNPGGYVTAARVVASQFIGSGTIFWEQDAKGNQSATEAIPAASRPTHPSRSSRSSIGGARRQARSWRRRCRTRAERRSSDSARSARARSSSGRSCPARAARSGSRSRAGCRRTSAGSTTSASNRTSPWRCRPTVAPGTDPTLDRALDVLDAVPVLPTH